MFSRLIGWLYAIIAIIFLTANSVILGMFGHKYGHGDMGKWLFAIVAGSVPWALAPHLHVMKAKQRMFGKKRRFAGIMAMVPFIAVYGVFVLYNVIGGTGATANARTEQADERKHVISDTARLEDQRKVVKASLDAVPKHRPKETLAPIIESTKRHRFWAATNECAADGVRSKPHRDYCAEYLRLQAEMASAVRGDKLLAEMTAIDVKLGSTTRMVSQADPQVAFLASATGWTEQQVMMLLLLATPLVLEIGALYWGRQALELLNVHIHMEEPEVLQPARRALPAHSVARMMAASDAAEAVQTIPMISSGTLATSDPGLQRAIYDRFWTEAVRPLPGGKETLLNVYSAYRAYCSKPHNRSEPYPFDIFGQLLPGAYRNGTEINGVIWMMGVILSEPMAVS